MGYIFHLLTPMWLLFYFQTKMNMFKPEIIVTTTVDVISKWVKIAFPNLFSLETVYFIVFLGW